tara:strand:- start:46 stop:1770 length:1725 start_codon:yes stop_codon:yes gene_type:complete
MGILRTDRVSGLGGANAIKGSVSFNNNQGDYINGFLKVHLDSSNRSNFLFDGDFTIECWVFKSKSTVSGDYDGLLYISTQWRFKWQASNYIMYYDNGTDAQFMNYNTNEGFLDNNWHHLAIVRSSNTITGYVDGTSYGTASESGNFNPGSNTELLIGYNVEGFGGFISNLRIVKGTAVYTGNFTPPTSELTAIDGTVLLCCQSPGNVLQEATGNYVVESVVHPNATLNSKPPSSSHFTPNSPVGFSTTTDVGTQFGSTFDGVTTFDSQAYMVLPGGNTRERNRGRGIFAGGAVSPTKYIQVIDISSGGIAQDFGDTANTASTSGSASSSTRMLLTNGYIAPASTNTIEFITIANIASSTDFGDLTVARRRTQSLSNSTRGVHVAGSDVSPAPYLNVIDFNTIATAGNAADFGDTSAIMSHGGSVASSTRGVYSLGYVAPSYVNTIEFITIATTGNGQNFGDLSAAKGYHFRGSICDTTRGLFAGGYNPAQNTIDFVTMASAGNASDFGDLIVARRSGAGTANSIHSIFAGGYLPGVNNTIDRVLIQTTGNAADFGDLFLKTHEMSGSSDSHGGL